MNHWFLKKNPHAIYPGSFGRRTTHEAEVDTLKDYSLEIPIITHDVINILTKLYICYTNIPKESIKNLETTQNKLA